MAKIDLGKLKTGKKVAPGAKNAKVAKKKPKKKAGVKKKGGKKKGDKAKG